MLRLVPKPPAEDEATENEGSTRAPAAEPELESDAVELTLEGLPDATESSHGLGGGDPPPVSGTQVKRHRPWWVDEFVSIERRIRRALVRR